MPEKHHFLSLLFLDIPAALQLRERHGEDAAADFLAEVMVPLKRILQEHGGQEVRTVGSTMLSAFNHAGHALGAAHDLRQAMNDSRISGLRPHLRIGLHAGDVTVHGRSFYSEAVSTSARLVTVCDAGQVVATRAFLDSLGPVDKGCFKVIATPAEWAAFVGELFEVVPAEGSDGEASCENAANLFAGAEATHTRPLGEHRADGSGRVELTELRRKNVASQESVGSAAKGPAAEPEAARLCLIRGRSIVIIDSANSAVSIGREEGNGVVLDLATASRRHAHIELRPAGFFLVDHSWNGTFIYDENGAESHVHNAECRLEDSGIICPGSPGSAAEVEAIRFIEAR